MKNKIRNLVIGFLLVFINTSFAQITFVKTFKYSNYWYGEGKAVQQTSDGGYIITGDVDSIYSAIYLIKTDANGDTLWTRTFGGVVNESYVGYSVLQTNDSGYIIVGGATTNFVGGQSDVYLIKTNSNGDTLWTKSYGSIGNDYGYSVKQTNDNGFIIAGVTDSFGAGGYDVFLIKTNSIGDTLWTKTYGGLNDDYAESIDLTADGGYIITGYSYSFGAGYDDVYLIKADSIGNILWTKTYGNGNHDEGYSVKQTTDGGFIITGRFNNGSIFLIKTNSIGDTLWSKTYGGGIANSVQQTVDGGYIITGTQINGFDVSLTQIWLIKTNTIGDTLWTKVYDDGSATGNGYSVQQTTDGGYIIAGYYQNGMLLIKTDSNGNSGCWQLDYLTYLNSIQPQVSNSTTIIKSGCTVSNPSVLVESGGTTITTECFNTGMNEIVASNYFTIYPNPTEDYFAIYIDKELYNTSLEIRNVLGEKKYSEKLNGKQAIVNCKELSSGIYFITLRTGSVVVTKKLIIIK